MDRDGQFAGTWRRSVLVLSVIVVVGALPLVRLGAPTQDALGFSSERAWKHLQFIAAEKHPYGSPYHTKVRAYLVGELRGLGLEVEEHSVSVFHPGWRREFRLVNVIARLRGTGGGRAIVLGCHYDSARNSYGAGDDGAAAAALVEVMRVLKEGRALRSDVVLVITDGEEQGLLGAMGLVREKEWMKEAGAVLNFEARGTSGPSIMFETSGGSMEMVKRFARGAIRPTTSSLSEAVYRFMPNDTDFTILKAPSASAKPRWWKRNADEDGVDARPGVQIPGLNFAFAGSYVNYHTEGDNLANVSVDSMRHHGINALSMVGELGNADLDGLRKAKGDAVYFDVLNAVVVRYPARLAVPLAALVAIGGIVVLIAGVRRKRMRWWGVIVGMFFLVLVLAACAGAGHGARMWLGAALDRHPEWSAGGLSLLAGLIVAATPLLYRRWLSTMEIAGGALAWGVIFAIGSAVYLRGASYLFLVPLATMAVTLGVLVWKETLGRREVGIVIMAMLPTLLVLPVPIYLGFLGLTLKMATVLATLPAMAWIAILPQLRMATAVRRRMTRVE